MKTFIFLIILSFTSCATSLKPNYSLLRNYSFDLQKQEPFQIPYYSRFKKNKKELFYIAADHTSNKDSLTFRLIEGAVKNFKPDFIIIEGITTGRVSRKYLSYIESCSKKNFKGCGEPTFTAFKALKNNIPFDGGEPNDIDIMNSSSNEGLSKEGVAYFYLLRIAIQWKRQKKINPDNYKEKLSNFIPVIHKRLSGKVQINFKGFENWYSLNSGKPFELQRLRNNDVAPVNDGNFSQRIANQIGILREKNILSLVASKFTLYDKILIVYGGGHLVKSRLVLTDMLGQPILESNKANNIK